MAVENFLDLVRKRVSCRAYRPDPIPDEVLNDCLEALRLAPSACNRQPWRLVVVREAGQRQRLCREALLPGIPMPWLSEAPVIIALGSKRELVTHRLAPLFSRVRYDLLDPGIAGEHLVLAAAAAGLGSCWIGWIRPGKVRKILNFPRGIDPVALISLGFPAAEREASSRLELSKICRFDRWKES